MLSPELVLDPLLEDDARTVLLGAPSSNMELSDYTSRIRAAICDWGAPPWLHWAIADWHAHTFCRARHSERTYKLVSGVRSGDPLADACMTGFIKEMRECLIKEGLLVSMQDLDGNPLDQAGPDDQHSHHHGYHGNGSSAAWVREDHAQLRYGDEGILRLVDSYKHLGMLHDQYLCRTLELVRRAKTARTAVGALSRRVLRNTKLPISVRRQASLACIDGALFSADGG